MNKKVVIRFLVILTLIYPAYMLFRADEILGVSAIQETEKAILNYQVSIWINWVVLASFAVYFKWTEKRNTFFNFTYGFIIVTFILYGFLYQSYVTAYDLPSSFSDNYTLGVLMAVQNIVVSGILTGILQGAVWWFTRRWHRRYT
ncbi:hypothetical protein [Salinimicrobium gaetbulicola]|uniref:Uncharacterized protein n=1 Tax=Salinimicrobium gaetbulicola TaxID=999702 RepID=A0ABW3ICB2_9FLAO